MSEVRTTKYSIVGEGLYPMTRIPRGVCLIINNMDFDYLHPRRASLRDARNMARVFKAMHFIVETKHNLTTQKMRDTLRELADDNRHDNADAFILIVMTHGQKGSLCGVDYDPRDENRNYLTYEEILEFLNNRYCPRLRNKPKIIFFQACNGGNRSVGVEDDISLVPKAISTRLPDASDFLLSFAAQEGYTTISYENGGIYVNHLADVIAEHSYHCDLIDMLGKVEDRVRRTPTRVRKRPTEDGSEMSDEIEELCLSTSVKLLGWSRKLFFNPTTADSIEIVLPTIAEIVSYRQQSIYNSPSEDNICIDPTPRIIREETEKSLWIIGGSKYPEVLARDGTKWIIRNDTGLTGDHRLVSNCNNRVLVFDLYGVYDWDKDNRSLRSLTSLDPPRHLYSHAFFNGFLYVMGGEIRGKPRTSCRVYDIPSNHWTDLKDMNRKTTDRTAVVLRGNIYVTPGKKDQPLNKLDMFDPVQETWSNMPGYMQESRCGHALAVCDNYIWVFGGHDGSNCLKDVERYCPGTGKWEKRCSMPTARTDLSATYFDGKFYAVGGSLGRENSVLDVVEIYDPMTNTWVTGPKLNLARADHSSGVL